MAKSIAWGIVGLGKIANKFSNDLKLVEGGHLQSVASRNLDKAKSFAEAHQANSYYDDYQQLFSDPNVDIVYIATPHDSHMNYAIEAINAGKHVLCEKPLAVNQSQVKKMIEASQAKKVFLMEAFWTRFNPVFRKVMQLVEEGAIGNVNYINADFCFYKEAPPESRMYNMELAGGSLLDVGVYPTFLAYQLFGYPKEIKSVATFHKTGADLQTASIFKYENGLANISSGFASKSDMIAKIYGSEGSIMIDAPWHHSNRYTINKGGDSETIDHPLNGMGFTYEIEECHQCIESNKLESTLWSHANSLDLISITDEIRSQIGLKYPFE